MKVYPPAGIHGRMHVCNGIVVVMGKMQTNLKITKHIWLRQCSRLPAQLKTGDSIECIDAIIKNKQHYQDHQEHVWALVTFFWTPEQGQAS